MKAKYVPDLTKQMALCEANYARLLKLLPNIDECERRDFIVDMGRGEALISISVEERFKFTSTLSVSQSYIKQSAAVSVQQLLSPKLMVRMYHDARMAEVVNPSKKSQLSGRYSYPNKLMHQVDEKIQLNEYLAQWLSHCITHGYQSQQIMTGASVGSH